MENHLEEKNNGIDFEWFLKRVGNHTQDVTINLHRDEVILGRGRNKGIRYTLGISRQHALLRKTSNCQWKIKDLYSVNGVFVNACKIIAGRFEAIKEFDIIGLGVAEATSEEYFSFILCRRLKPQQNNHEDTPQNSDQCVDKSVKNKYRLNTKEKSQESSIDSKNFNEDKNLTIVHNTASKAVDADDWVQFPKGKRKRKRKEIIIISSSDESDCDVVYISQKKSKLCKRKHIIPFDEKLMGEKMLLQTVLPDKAKQDYKDFSNSCNEIDKEKINNIVQRRSSSDETLKNNRYSNYVYKKEEHSCGNNKICNGSFDLGNKLNIGVGDKELNDRLVWPPEPNDWNKENVSSLETFFDVEIEDTKVQLNKEEEKESKHVKMKSEEMTSPQLKPVEKKHQTTSTKLTKALPMRFRPNYVRGREEWFKEKMPKNSLNNVAVDEVAYSIAENKFKASKLTSVKTSNKTDSLNIAEPKSKKFKKYMGNRLRVPGGGATIGEDVTSGGLGIPSSGKSNLKVPSPEIIKHCDKSVTLANNRVQTSNKSKTAYNTQPIQRFKSRNEQLMQDLMVAPNSCKKKKEARKERDAILHSGWKCQTNDNPLKHFKIPKKKALE